MKDKRSLGEAIGILKNEKELWESVHRRSKGKNERAKRVIDAIDLVCEFVDDCVTLIMRTK